MFIGTVIGDLVSTCKHRALFGARLLWVERSGSGRRILALDSVDAGPGDRVLVLDEGNGAAQVLGRSRGPVRTVIVGVVDVVDGPGSANGGSPESGESVARVAGRR